MPDGNCEQVKGYNLDYYAFTTRAQSPVQQDTIGKTHSSQLLFMERKKRLKHTSNIQTFGGALPKGMVSVSPVTKY